ncbi:MAG TPA: helicase HerA-like domain-containing protein, partial [Solirubrobacteraceae bacterium]|nr:helicase HerA-like domain-containing protein [Solirubrobacteraceae bacterium]
MSTATAARGVFRRHRRPAPYPGLLVSAPVPLVGEAGGERGFVIAERLSGERALPVAGRMVLLSEERLCRHLLVCGATGAGKTETLLRLAWAVAKESDAPVFYLDGKGDRENAERFSGLMAGASRNTSVFPHQPFDGWRGEAHEIQGRLMEIIDYSSEGPAAWYRDVAKTTLRLVCEHPDGPPRSSAHVLSRMDHALLTTAHPGSSAIAALTPAQV